MGSALLSLTFFFQVSAAEAKLLLTFGGKKSSMAYLANEVMCPRVSEIAFLRNAEFHSSKSDI
jgi:hypothetical protein